MSNVRDYLHRPAAEANEWRDPQAHRWADRNCDLCDGDGTVNTDDARYRGWRWCDCAVTNRDMLRIGPDLPKGPAAEAAEGTRPAGQAEAAESISARDLARLEKRVLFAAKDWHLDPDIRGGEGALSEAVDNWLNPFTKPAAGVEPLVVAVAGREASATVERRHREDAWVALDEESEPPHPHSAAGKWIRGEPTDGFWFPTEKKVAQALANAEAYGRASALEKP